MPIAWLAEEQAVAMVKLMPRRQNHSAAVVALTLMLAWGSVDGVILIGPLFLMNPLCRVTMMSELLTD